MKKMYRLLVSMATAVILTTISVPVYASEIDDSIESSAKRSYVFKNFLKSDDVKIESKDGVVTLSGSVSENFHKALAQEAVTNLANVRSVENKIEVKGTPLTVNSDAWIHDKVKVTLMFHRSVNAANTNISIKDGVVTLKGEAASQAQKELTTEYARDVEGVKEVNNEMTVAKDPAKEQTVGEQIDDSSITAQVKMTLLYHRSTSALNTKVETKDGVVTLTGKAGNAAEIKLASKLANDVNGVRNVHNLMTTDK